MKTTPLKKWTALAAGIVMSGTSILPLAKAEGEKEKPTGGVIGILLAQRKKAEMTQAISNSKQIYYLMIEFDGDYGEFPSDSTEGEDGMKGYKGKHSNDYFGQFFAGGYTKSEEIFYAKGGAPTTKKADNDTSTKAKTLAAGECGFAYYKGESTSSNSGKPLVFAPMTGKGFKFDPKPYGGKAVVLHIDGSVRAYEIDKNGDARMRNGKKLFDAGVDTVWGEKGPDAKNLVFPK